VQSAYAAIVLLPLLALPVAAQSFEAATIKRSSAAQTVNGFSPSPGRLIVQAASLEQMIHAAFHVHTGALIGATGWMQSEPFDIEAKTSAPATFDLELTMLRALITDRFQLHFHNETRPITTLAFTLAKSGLKIHPAADQNAKEAIVIRAGRISGTAIPFGHLMSVLSAQLNRDISNETGLTGKFDLSLTYVRDDSPDAASGPSVYAGVQEQLGLKLETRKAPGEVMVIDSAQRPGEN
jgi:uncharacterized protein (TIGR03435 family)